MSPSKIKTTIDFAIFLATVSLIGFLSDGPVYKLIGLEFVAIAFGFWNFIDGMKRGFAIKDANK